MPGRTSNRRADRPVRAGPDSSAMRSHRHGAEPQPWTSASPARRAGGSREPGAAEPGRASLIVSQTSATVTGWARAAVLRARHLARRRGTRWTGLSTTRSGHWAPIGYVRIRRAARPGSVSSRDGGSRRHAPRPSTSSRRLDSRANSSRLNEYPTHGASQSREREVNQLLVVLPAPPAAVAGPRAERAPTPGAGRGIVHVAKPGRTGGEHISSTPPASSRAARADYRLGR
jgi:hypothetical protein